MEVKRGRGKDGESKKRIVEMRLRERGKREEGIGQEPEKKGKYRS